MGKETLRFKVKIEGKEAGVVALSKVMDVLKTGTKWTG
jgi:hypothetical protein